MARRMGDPGLSPRCYRNDRGLHGRCASVASATLADFQQTGDRWWCGCECHGAGRTRSGSTTDRRRYDAWLADYQRLLGSAENVT